MTRAPDLLAAIVGATRRIVETRRDTAPASMLERQAAARTPDADAFRRALRRPGQVNVIAECKRRSPSKGVLRPIYDPIAVASGYAQAGAVALSVLTEPTFFDGSLAHLASIREAVSLPLLRKDFIVDEYQLLEARAAGADAVLLIVAALDDHSLRSLRERAAAFGLAALVEVHDVTELERAVAAGAEIIGVNNRNLRTLDVDVAASREVAARMPAHITAVSESGLKTAADIQDLLELGYHAFLIGERFMTALDPGKALQGLLAGVTGGPEGPPLQRHSPWSQSKEAGPEGPPLQPRLPAPRSGRGGSLDPPSSDPPSSDPPVRRS
jgi:indole-3-glycerol phosphate synthase